MIQSNATQAGSAFPGNVVKVRRATTDHGAKCDDGAELTGASQMFGRQGQFESARNPNQCCVSGRNPATGQALVRPGKQLINNELVEPAGYQPNANRTSLSLYIH
mgnify:CR=1 FL=1|jgi:hypothetical protein